MSLSYRALSVYRPNYAVEPRPAVFAPSRSQGHGRFYRRSAKADGRRRRGKPFKQARHQQDNWQGYAAAQKALQAGQWSEALRDLEAARSKAPLTNYDVKSIEEFTGFANIRLNNLKAAQTAYEAAVATGAYKTEELARIFRVLFQLAATNKQDAKAIEYGERAADAGSATDQRSDDHEPDLLPAKRLQEFGGLG